MDYVCVNHGNYIKAYTLKAISKRTTKKSNLVKTKYIATI